MYNKLEQVQEEGQQQPILPQRKPKYPDYNHDPIFRNFLNSSKSSVTKIGYSHYLNRFYLSRPQNQNLTRQEIIRKDPKKNRV